MSQLQVVADLESSPDLFDEFAQTQYGLPPEWGFSEIFGFEEDLLSMVPKPCLGVVLLLDYNSEALEKVRAKERKEYSKQPESGLFFANQLLPKSCASLAILHILANHHQTIGLGEGSVVSKILKEDNHKNGKDRGLLVVGHCGDKNLIRDATGYAKHVDFSKGEGPSRREPQPHFICFIEKDGKLFELDPAKGIPIPHGSTKGDVLSSAVRVIQKEFFERNPESMLFSMMAFVKKE